MSAIFFAELGMEEPKYHLGIGSGTHGEQTGKMLQAVEKTLIEEQPSCVLVYGDTNSTLAGALAASKLSMPVAHVEAGLRSFNRHMPEEINRVLTDHLSEILFAPTAASCVNLRNEGISGQKVHLVGDVMYDVALRMKAQATRQSTIMTDLGLKPGGFVLCTAHRAENTDCPARLRSILSALTELSRDVPVIFPVHPRTRKVLVEQALYGGNASGVRLIEPVGYLDMVILEASAALIATDSGGVQKEAFFHRVPCVTMREETEWVESIELGWNRLAPPGNAAELCGTMRSALGTRGVEGSPYGAGQAARQIAAILRGRSRPDSGHPAEVMASI
jgi:UDP-GlcNAc3NAcA epimerase